MQSYVRILHISIYMYNYVFLVVEKVIPFNKYLNEIEFYDKSPILPAINTIYMYMYISK